MKQYIYILILFFIIVFYNNCKKEDPYDYEIEYQDGYPNVLAGYWKAYDIEFTDNGLVPLDYEPYDLITALDPNNENNLIIDNIYNSNQRVRTFINRSSDGFYIIKGEQLEKVNAQYDIKTISIDGEYRDDPESGEILLIFTGLYDKYDDLYDSVIVVAYRKTGFEDVDEYEFENIFEN